MIQLSQVTFLISLALMFFQFYYTPILPLQICESIPSLEEILTSSEIAQMLNAEELEDLYKLKIQPMDQQIVKICESGEARLSLIQLGVQHFFLLTEIDDKKIYKVLEPIIGTYEMYTGDIDGDGLEEIILGHISGFGFWHVSIFKYIEDGYHELFCSDEFDTGFRYQLLDNCSYQVANIVTGYRDTLKINLSEVNPIALAELYAEDGTLKKQNKGNMYFSKQPTFIRCPQAKDINYDGIDEILAAEVPALGKNWGVQYAILKYDISAERMVVFKTSYLGLPSLLKEGINSKLWNALESIYRNHWYLLR